MNHHFPSATPSFLTKSEYVANAIRRMVMSGELRPGDRVVVTRIAKLLSVSDTPVREAIKQLVSDGFLEESAHVGAVVPTFTLEEVSETFHMRGALAALGVQLNAGSYTQEVMSRIDAILERGRQLVEEEDHGAYGDVNTQFHANLLNTGHFKAVYTTYLGLMARTERFRAGFRNYRWNIQRSHEEHMAIRNAIAAGEWERAAHLIREHEVNSMRPLIDFINQEMASNSGAAQPDE